jgi:hypothetical protein
VYPARSEGGRWRAVWYEAGEREQCEAATEGKLTPKLERVAERLKADAPKMRRPGAALIAHYLDPDRLPVRDRWSRRHADTQRRLCERFAVPVIGAVACQDIKTEHTQRIVNAAPTAGEGDRKTGSQPPSPRSPGSGSPRDTGLPPSTRPPGRKESRSARACSTPSSSCGKTVDGVGLAIHPHRVPIRQPGRCQRGTGRLSSLTVPTWPGTRAAYQRRPPDAREAGS